MHYILYYKTIDGYVKKRGPYRDKHLKLARQAHEKGELVMAGAYAEPADGAVFIFKGESPVPAETFARNDPYVRNGLVINWYIRPWTVVIGNE
jgi:hypothetical protein